LAVEVAHGVHVLQLFVQAVAIADETPGIDVVMTGAASILE